MTVINRQPAKGVIFHTDRGVQYTSKQFRKILKGYGIIQSMSRKGNCWDNDVTDEFIKPLVCSEKAKIEEDDAVIFFNYRNDRPKELTTVLTQKDR
jgi:transposase InsO family protein